MGISARGRPLVIAAVLVLVALLAAAVLVGRGLIWPSASTVALPLRTVASVPLPGQNSRFDYEAVDPGAHRLFIDHMDEGTMLEVDTRTDRVIASIPGLPTVTGVLVVPALHRIFASTAGDGQVVTIDETTAHVLARTPVGRFPDGLAYVPTTNQVWVSDESGGAETVLDAASGQRLATVALGGEAGNVRYDAGGDRVLVDVQTRNEVAVLDPRTRAVTGRVLVPGCDHDHGLLIAASRAFVACDGNNHLITLALPQLNAVGDVEVGDQPDVLAYDPSRQLLYVAAESGVVTTVDTRTAAGRVTGRAYLAGNAHVVAVDPWTGRAYFPIPDAGHGRPGLLITVP